MNREVKRPLFLASWHKTIRSAASMIDGNHKETVDYTSSRRKTKTIFVLKKLIPLRWKLFHMLGCVRESSAIA